MPDLEVLLGDPSATGNPMGFDACMTADERCELAAEAWRVLDSWGLGAELVPVTAGGRLRALDDLVVRLRPVFRRDVSLGLGFGISSLLAAFSVWTAGTASQQRFLRDLLMTGAQIATVYPTRDAEEYGRQALEASVNGGGSTLSGVSSPMASTNTARAFLLDVATPAADRANGRSLFLTATADMHDSVWTHLPRLRTAGARGVWFSRVRANGARLNDDTLIGGLGRAGEVTALSAQPARAVLTGLSVATADTALRVVTRFATSRYLYGATVADLPHARRALTTTFVELLIADALATTAARAIQAAPSQASLATAVAGHLVPQLLADAMERLSVVLGARFYLREGEHAIFGKHQRDLPLLTVDHGPGAGCLGPVLTHLRGSVGESSRGEAEPIEAVFDRSAELPDLVFSQLTPVPVEPDAVIVTLSSARDWPELAGDSDRDLIEQIDSLDQRLAELGHHRTRIRAHGSTTSGDAETIARSYVLLSASACCLGLWRSARNRGEQFLGDTPWLTAALVLLANRTPGAAVGPLAPQLNDALWRELAYRVEHARSLDTRAEPVLV
ncbi:acyl-CoA dehydrogenase family protein [Rugosimonospora africana]|uniref:Acyl-CoA dehydrogenase n=1 Tax=Rugosimonospora africana TaxID=556532 RepID=A0A8J3R355_9ACTN|nr:acyl-CoA dehydrogenase family protein [Rugosimonospora africana]GIH21406.1 acyl-CoA dehydrogenase [Rugosimonospora africana]